MGTAASASVSEITVTDVFCCCLGEEQAVTDTELITDIVGKMAAIEHRKRRRVVKTSDFSSAPICVGVSL